MALSKPQLYRDLAAQLVALLADEANRVANAANAAALIYHGLPDLNWAGFYFREGAELVLGPFQGKPACVRIPVGKGVCGIAAARAAAVLVPMSTSSRATSPAIPPRAPNSSFRLSRPARFRACSTSTVRSRRASTRTTG